jgi:hypothetical protein
MAALAILVNNLPSQQQLKPNALFAWLISHQPTVLFSQNKPATSNQPEPASSTLLSEQTSTSHQPPGNRTGCKTNKMNISLQRN